MALVVEALAGVEKHLDSIHQPIHAVRLMLVQEL